MRKKIGRQKKTRERKTIHSSLNSTSCKFYFVDMAVCEEMTWRKDMVLPYKVRKKALPFCT